MNFDLQSKIDGCSLKRVGELPFATSEDMKCIGIPGSSESSDNILLVDRRKGLIEVAMNSFMYVTNSLYFHFSRKSCSSLPLKLNFLDLMARAGKKQLHLNIVMTTIHLTWHCTMTGQ